MAKTYADTPRTIGSFDGTELIVVQDGASPAPEGFSQMKKTTLAALRTFMQDGVTRSLIYRGTCTYAELLAKTGMSVGDMWNVVDKDGQNYAWTGSEWDALGESKDLSGKADKSYVDTELAKKANQENTYTKSEVDEIVEAATPEDYESVKASVVAISSECEEVKSRIKNIKLSLTNEGLLHIEEVSA